MQLRNTVESRRGTGNATLTFENQLYGLSIINVSSTPDLTVNINGKDFYVPSGFPMQIDAGPFKRAVITSTGAWYAMGLV